MEWKKVKAEMPPLDVKVLMWSVRTKKYVVATAKLFPYEYVKSKHDKKTILKEYVWLYQSNIQPYIDEDDWWMEFPKLQINQTYD